MRNSGETPRKLDLIPKFLGEPNYLPAVTEAFYQRVPLVVVTSDRSPYLLNQLETQKIDQRAIFGPVCKKEVTLPVVKTDDDEWYCSRLINEAIIEMNNRGLGPVHINIPTTGDPTEYTCEQLPEVNRIDYYSEHTYLRQANLIAKKLYNKKILVVFGENYKNIDSLIPLIDEFANKTGAVVIRDYISNFNYDNAILSYRITESFGSNDFSQYIPDIVITLNNNILSNNLKRFLRENRKKIEHWCVDEAGVVRDVFKCLRILIACENTVFFQEINKYLSNNKADLSYKNTWKSIQASTQFKEPDFSEIKIVKTLIDNIPDKAVLHTAILNSTRAYHLFETRKKLKSYSNIGALGIDGCMSTFIGHSFATDGLCFLVIGDLSFFYDMNSLGISGIRNNVRILLLNNGGGAEFHFNMGIENVPTLNDYISVKHNKVAKAWAESMGFRYLAARNSAEVEKNMNQFVKECEKPILFEVFSNMETDAEIVKGTLNSVKSVRSGKTIVKSTIKSILGRR